MKRNVMIALFALTATAAVYASGLINKPAKTKAPTECCSNQPDCCIEKPNCSTEK